MDEADSARSEKLAWPIALLVQLRAFEALRHRDYRLLWYGQVFGSMGTWMDQVTRGWLIYELTNSALQLGLGAVSRRFHFYYCRPSPVAPRIVIRANFKWYVRSSPAVSYMR